MKFKRAVSILAVLLLLGFVWACKSEAPLPETVVESTVDEFSILVDYLETNGLDYPNQAGKWIFGHEVELDKYFIIDIRSTEDFNMENSHFDGAVNVAMADLLDYLEKNEPGKPILVAGYNGMDASYASALINMMGYESYTLKFGMSYWLVGNGSSHEFAGANDDWTKNVGDLGLDADWWVYDESPPVPIYSSFPVLATGETTGNAILRERVVDSLKRGLKSKRVEEISKNLNDYNIINWWKTSYGEDYPGNPYIIVGHFLGALQFMPGTHNFKLDGNLNAFDPNRPNLVYCFTGQTSAKAEAYLTVLGYEAYGVAYGVNSTAWSKLIKADGKGFNRWPKPYDN